MKGAFIHGHHKQIDARPGCLTFRELEKESAHRIERCADQAYTRTRLRFYFRGQNLIVARIEAEAGTCVPIAVFSQFFSRRSAGFLYNTVWPAFCYGYI